MSNIPEEIKSKIENESRGYATNKQFSGEYKLNKEKFLSHAAGACFGYSLALEELEKKDKEIERVKGLLERAHMCGYTEGDFKGSGKYSMTESFTLFKQKYNL